MARAANRAGVPRGCALLVALCLSACAAHEPPPRAQAPSAEAQQIAAINEHLRAERLDPRRRPFTCDASLAQAMPPPPVTLAELRALLEQRPHTASPQHGGLVAFLIAETWWHEVARTCAPQSVLEPSSARRWAWQIRDKLAHRLGVSSQQLLAHLWRTDAAAPMEQLAVQLLHETEGLWTAWRAVPASAASPSADPARALIRQVWGVEIPADAPSPWAELGRRLAPGLRPRSLGTLGDPAVGEAFRVLFIQEPALWSSANEGREQLAWVRQQAEALLAHRHGALDPRLPQAWQLRGAMLAAQLRRVLRQRFGAQWWQQPSAAMYVEQLAAAHEGARASTLLVVLGEQTLSPRVWLEELHSAWLEGELTATASTADAPAAP